jgi:glycosyltransferase involved in cell wall biosynthesis
MKKLAILIPTLPERGHFLDRMLANLKPQLGDEVSLHIDNTPQTVMSIGNKRNVMLEKSDAEYSVFIDDDDFVSNEYVSLILNALASNPDVVTFEGWYTENGKNRVDWVIKLGEKYEARTEGGKYMFFRWPNHLSVIKTEISRSVKFPNVANGEDYRWSKEIKDRGLLRTSVHIPLQLYHYDYRTCK